eukprot:766349-Hanusia_phi.AAC.9
MEGVKTREEKGGEGRRREEKGGEGRRREEKGGEGRRREEKGGEGRRREEKGREGRQIDRVGGTKDQREAERQKQKLGERGTLRGAGDEDERGAMTEETDVVKDISSSNEKLKCFDYQQSSRKPEMCSD